MERIRCDLNISAAVMAAVYAGEVRWLQVMSRDGQQVRFAAHLLRPFVTHAGVNGCFEFQVNESKRLTGLQRLAAR